MREYIWLDDMPPAVVADIDTATPNLYFVHADHLNRPLKMTDGTEAVVWDAIYRPFGEIQSITGATANNLRFPGQYFLIESGLAYNWHRHYDPTLGRYTQPDPLGFVDGPSVYAYARSAPAMHLDPNGLQSNYSSPMRRFGYPPFPFPGSPEWTDQFCKGMMGLANWMSDIVKSDSNDQETSPKPPTGSRGIDKTPWSGDHGEIKDALGLGGRDKVVVSPDGDIWTENPDGSWTNQGPAKNFPESGKPSGRRGKDRR